MLKIYRNTCSGIDITDSVLDRDDIKIIMKNGKDIMLGELKCFEYENNFKKVICFVNENTLTYDIKIQ